MLTRRPAAPYLIDYAPGLGVVARYHIDKDKIDAVIDTLRTQTDGVSLSLWLYKGIGTNDQFLDWSGGFLVPQLQTNLTNLLKTLKAKGFNWVQIAPQFYAANDPRQQVFSEAWYTENWFFIALLVPLLESIGLEYMIDVCPEVNDVYPTNLNLQAYAKRLWVDVTSWFYPGGVPAWNFSMSFVPTNWNSLADAFQGNPPAILLPHLYSGDLVSAKGQLDALGYHGMPWIAGEDFTLVEGQESYAQKWADFIKQTRQPVERICPWPLEPGQPLGTEINVAPPISPVVWRGVGA